MIKHGNMESSKVNGLSNKAILIIYFTVVVDMPMTVTQLV